MVLENRSLDGEMIRDMKEGENGVMSDERSVFGPTRNFFNFIPLSEGMSIRRSSGVV